VEGPETGSQIKLQSEKNPERVHYFWIQDVVYILVVMQFAGSSKIVSENLDIESVSDHVIKKQNIPWLDHESMKRVCGSQ
jgi:hypothetical protein